ncbi:MAG: energy transducer TonB [Cyclobacteriaceae bacterium]|nr:energy transducer TonB [Cyclobacteriaceae bacterium]
MENKKNPNIDLRKKTGLFLNIGLVISLALVLFAFEYKSYNDGSLMDLAAINDDFEEMTEIPPTKQPPPPPPKIQQPEIIEVPDEEEIEEDIEVDLDIDITDETVIEETIFEEPEDEEVADEIFTIVEKQPSFLGGDRAFYKYISKKMKYPSQARRMGIEGKVFVQFVVDEKGNITDVKVIRGVGAGCDEEAIRVIKNSPKWNPGKQRGKAVKVRMVLPITFKLS